MSFHIHKYVHTHTHIHERRYILYIYICWVLSYVVFHIHKYVYIYTNMYAHVHTCMYAGMSCIHTYDICTHMMYTHMYTHICMQVCHVHTYIYAGMSCIHTYNIWIKMMYIYTFIWCIYTHKAYRQPIQVQCKADTQFFLHQSTYMYSCASMYIYAYIPYMYTHDVYINILYRYSYCIYLLYIYSYILYIYSYGLCRHTIHVRCNAQQNWWHSSWIHIHKYELLQPRSVAATICCSHDAPFHLHKHLHTYTYVCEAGGCSHYGVAHMSRNDITIVLYCKRDLQKRRYSAKETYNLIDPTDRSHPIDDAGVSRLFKIIGLFLQKSHIKETIF